LQLVQDQAVHTKEMRLQLQVLRRETGIDNSSAASPELQAALEALEKQQVKLNKDAQDLAARLGVPASDPANTTVLVAAEAPAAIPVVTEEGYPGDEDAFSPDKALAILPVNVVKSDAH
jgi:hypothetical protein